MSGADDAIDEFLRASPNFWPTLAALAVLSGSVLALLVAGGRRPTAWQLALWAALLVALAATLSPADQSAGFGECQVVGFQRYVVPGLGGRLNEGSLNTLMLIPIGALAVLAFRRTLAVTAAGALGVVAVEAVQSVVPALGRACDTVDLQANLLGLCLGAAGGRAWLEVTKVYCRR